jgi:methionyl-tRNA formyltransferase
VTIRPRVAFFGTPDVAVPTLERLVEIADVSLVVTQPDRPIGRSKDPQPPIVKRVAVEMGIEVVQPVRSADTAGMLAEREPFDVAVLVAFGQMIRPAALTIPRRGFLNVHFSILPRWRGAAPVQRALMAGDDRVGVSVMQLEAGLDTGPVLAIHSTAVSPDENAGAVFERLAVDGANLLSEVLAGQMTKKIVAVPQPEDGVTMAEKVTAEDRPIVWTNSAEAIVNRIRGLAPRPSATARFEGKPMKILSARTAAGSAPPGVIGADGTVGAGSGLVQLLEVQPAGKQAMPAAAWLRGLHQHDPHFDDPVDRP